MLSGPFASPWSRNAKMMLFSQRFGKYILEAGHVHQQQHTDVFWCIVRHIYMMIFGALAPCNFMMRAGFASNDNNNNSIGSMADTMLCSYLCYVWWWQRLLHTPTLTPIPIPIQLKLKVKVHCMHINMQTHAQTRTPHYAAIYSDLACMRCRGM